MLSSDEDGYPNDPWSDHRVVESSSSQYLRAPGSLHKRKSHSVLRTQTGNGGAVRPPARSQTASFSSSSSAHHPLRGLGDGAGTESRPSLARMLTRRNSSDEEDEPVGPSDKSKGKQPERLVPVIVHEVTALDSLAGVSLKYGISIAELRKVNHMWTSDSIHLRKTLYIPVHKAKLPSTPSAASDLIDLFDTSADPPISLPRPLTPERNIQRIPESELSFFPPPTQSPRRPIPQSQHSRATTDPSPYPPGPLSFSINSILTSTRENIMARLSLDSNSDRSQPSTEEEGHELDLVPPRPSDPDPFGDFVPVTPRARHTTPASTITTRAAAYHTDPIPERRRKFRIEQMEPSPAMQISKDKRTTGQLVDLSIDDDGVFL